MVGAEEWEKGPGGSEGRSCPSHRGVGDFEVQWSDRFHRLHEPLPSGPSAFSTASALRSILSSSNSASLHSMFSRKVNKDKA